MVDCEVMQGTGVAGRCAGLGYKVVQGTGV